MLGNSSDARRVFLRELIGTGHGVARTANTAPHDTVTKNRGISDSWS
jgi:hypothetical protein